MGRPKVKVIDDSIQEDVPSNSEDAVNEASSVTLNEAERTEESPNDKPKKAQKPGKATHPPKRRNPRSKKYQENSKDLDRNRNYPITEAVEMVKKLSYSKFPGSMEIHINTRMSGIRGLVTLPFVAGKKLNILAFGPSSPLTRGPAPRTEEGVILGNDDTIEEILKGKINFDIVVTTPEWMPKLAKAARVLGPRGLMPNPKNGTITDDLKKAIEGFQAGKTEYRTEPKAPIIHLALGKLTQPTEELSENIKVLLSTVGKSRIKKVVVAPTIGPSVKLDLSSL